MVIKLALAVLATWMVGILFFSSAGDAVHVLLLVGLALLLLGFRARRWLLLSTRRSRTESKYGSGTA